LGGGEFLLTLSIQQNQISQKFDLLSNTILNTFQISGNCTLGVDNTDQSGTILFKPNIIFI
jgi:hypothetical protein